MALLIRKQKKIFPNITERTILNKMINIPSHAPPSGPVASEPVASEPVARTLIYLRDKFISALTWLFENWPTLDDDLKAIPDKIFESLIEFGYLVKGSFVGIMYKGKWYIITPAFNALINALKTVKTKGLFGSLMSIFSSKPHLLRMTPGEIFDRLPDSVRLELRRVGYTRDSPVFAALVNALSHGLQKCDEEDCIKSLTSGQDRFTLKTKLEGILKKLELNAEDEFLKFQVKVIEFLNNRFSVFAKFQQKVIEELYQIGIPQIPEITPDFFQILDPEQHERDLEQMRDIYDKFDYAKI
jgi:hypothetical protein